MCTMLLEENTSVKFVENIIYVPIACRFTGLPCMMMLPLSVKNVGKFSTTSQICGSTCAHILEKSRLCANAAGRRSNYLVLYIATWGFTRTRSRSNVWPVENPSEQVTIWRFIWERTPGKDHTSVPFVERGSITMFLSKHTCRSVIPERTAIYIMYILTLCKFPHEIMFMSKIQNDVYELGHWYYVYILYKVYALWSLSKKVD